MLRICVLADVVLKRRCKLLGFFYNNICSHANGTTHGESMMSYRVFKMAACGHRVGNLLPASVLVTVIV